MKYSISKKIISNADVFLPKNLMLPFKKWYYFWWLKNSNDMVEPDLAIIRKILQEGDTAIDVGAFYGR